jgi:methionyl-tRNA formyltransferase
MRLAFCGTPGFAIPQLEALLSDKFFEVVQVVTQPDRPSGRGQKLQPSPVKVFSQKAGLPVLSPENINSPESIESLKQLNLDAIVVVAFGQILRKDFLNLCPNKCVNLHGSLLPRWRGAAPIQRALMEGDRESGVSLQVIVAKLDAGPVIGERPLTLPIDMNALELHDQLSQLGASLFLDDFKRFLKGEITPKAQDESQVTYAHKISKDETKIDWSWPAARIHNQVRGLFMGPQAWSSLDGLNYKIHRTEVVIGVVSCTGSRQPGEVLAVEKDFFIVGTGENSLKVSLLQPESKKKMSAEEFLRGYSLKKGAVFGAES